jgi:hypothetical protein
VNSVGDCATCDSTMNGLWGLYIVVISLSQVRGYCQSAPSSSSQPWHSKIEEQYSRELKAIPEASSQIDLAKTYSLAGLVNFAEQHNPETRFGVAGGQDPGNRNRSGTPASVAQFSVVVDSPHRGAFCVELCRGVARSHLNVTFEPASLMTKNEETTENELPRCASNWSKQEEE